LNSIFFSVEQHCSRKLYMIMEIFYISAVQHSNY
jgi:hypothetical protein